MHEHDRRQAGAPWALPALGAILAVVLGACTTPPTPGQAQPLPPPRIAEPIEHLDFQYRAVPGSGDVAAGVVYRYELYSHCGLAYPLAWDFDVSFWDPVRGGEPFANPPEGIENPFDDGLISLVGNDAARYVSSGGRIVELIRSPDAERRGWLCV